MPWNQLTKSLIQFNFWLLPRKHWSPPRSVSTLYAFHHHIPSWANITSFTMKIFINLIMHSSRTWWWTKHTIRFKENRAIIIRLKGRVKLKSYGSLFIFVGNGFIAVNLTLFHAQFYPEGNGVLTVFHDRKTWLGNAENWCKIVENGDEAMVGFTLL